MLRTNSILKGKRCQCSACGEFFSSASSFDKHRTGPAAARVCADPESVGLSISSRGENTFWTTPMPDGFAWAKEQGE